MTTFQVAIYSAVQGITELLPISSHAHRLAISFLTGWPMPQGVLLGTFYLASALALLTAFIHDWVSMLSCTIQLVIYRKRPMTLDERMPLFLMLATLPIVAAWYYLADEIGPFFNPGAESRAPLLIAGSVALFTLPLAWADGWSRKNKGMFDWSIKDSLAVGVLQAFAVLPGCGRTNATLFAGLVRNFNREAAAKFGFFAALPVLALAAFHHLRELSFGAPEPMPDMSWMSLAVGFLISYFASLLAVGGFMRYVQRGSDAPLGRYALYRFALAAVLAGAYFFKAR
jgi:undecaprenyl-diphosphatase